MPVVFVHGVNVRQGSDYDELVRARDAMLRRFALTGLVPDPSTAKILNPYWGHYGVKLAWNGASVPTGSVQAFGLDANLAQLLLAEGSTPLPEDDQTAVLAIAKQSLPDAVDMIFAVALQEADSEDLDEVAALAAKAISYADHNPRPAWLDSTSNDTIFLSRLQAHVEVWRPPDAAAEPAVPIESFGLAESWDKVREGIARVGSAAGALGSGLVLSAVRQPLTPVVARFLGDVFVYIDQRGDIGATGAIVEELSQAIKDADQARSTDDPHLVIVAHSMGGNIAYDILSHYCPNLVCDALVTVGSQVALLEEMKLYKASSPHLPANPAVDRVAKPDNIHHWLNVFDRNDVLSYAASPVFADVADYEYSTGKGLLSAHTTYFLRPTFHERLGVRLRGMLL